MDDRDREPQESPSAALTAPSDNLPTLILSERFAAALAYMVHLHARQARKATQIPYIGHLLSVAGLVLDDGGSEDEAIAALLHDAVEDQGGEATLAEIQRRFGERVAGIVAACSDSTVDSAMKEKPPWRERKEAYLDHLRNTPSESPYRDETLRVSLADKLHNARAILADYRVLGEGLWGRFNARRKGTLWYYHELVNAFCEAGSHSPMLYELQRVVAEVEKLAAAKWRDTSSSQ